tara:strand:- start:4386 stop:4697 length:312 start_codon:yes stop_codon:yes gene_type:complete
MTVYVVQEVKNINLLPATEYGDIEILLPPGQVAFSTAPTVKRLFNNLRKFTSDDYLLMVGDPAAIAIASAVASHISCGNMRLLKWDKQERKYFVVKVSISGGK